MHVARDDNTARLVVLSLPPLLVVEPSDPCHWASNGHNCPQHAEEHELVTKHKVVYCYSSSSNGTGYSVRGCPLNAAKSSRNEFFVISDLSLNIKLGTRSFVRCSSHNSGQYRSRRTVSILLNILKVKEFFGTTVFTGPTCLLRGLFNTLCHKFCKLYIVEQ